MKMPVIFIGHGTPMNIIENNVWTKCWRTLGEKLPQPQGILAISAHWYTRGAFLQEQEKPEMIYDMYGFPEELYRLQYPATNPLRLHGRIKTLLGEQVTYANDWGYDHGAYAPLFHMYPKANIPLVQLSVNYSQSGAYHLALGQALAALREEGILIYASGNIVHNLRLARPQIPAYDWAEAFDQAVAAAIRGRDDEALIHYESLADGASMAVPTPDHYYPLLYAYGASDATDHVQSFNVARTMGSLSMTSYLWHTEEMVL